VASEVFFGWKAEEDLASIHRYIASRDIAAAEKFLDAIEARCQSLADFLSKAAPETTSAQAIAFCSMQSGW
jgi:plasmid stabilization system protein ParE